MLKNQIGLIENILRYIFQVQDIDYRKIEIKIIYNYDEIMKRVAVLKETLAGETEIVVSIMNIEKYIIETYKRYNEISYSLMNRISIKSFKKEIETVLLSEKIEIIKDIFEKYCQRKELLMSFQTEIIDDLEKLALRKNYIVEFNTSKEVPLYNEANTKSYHR